MNNAEKGIDIHLDVAVKDIENHTEVGKLFHIVAVV